MRKFAFAGVLLALLGGSQLSDASPPEHLSFSTGGYTAYHVQFARTQVGQLRSIVVAARDGSLHCFDRNGNRLWKNESSRGMPFDLEVADLDGDGRDEVLMASTDGALYVVGPEGELKWRFAREAPLLQVCAVPAVDGSMRVLTGGIGRTVFALAADGALLAERTYDSVIRHLHAFSRHEGADPEVALVTARNPSSAFRLSLITPELVDKWAEPVLLTGESMVRNRFARSEQEARVSVFAVVADDVNGDGERELILSEAAFPGGRIRAYDTKGELVFRSPAGSVAIRAYCMTLLELVELGASRQKQLLGMVGNQLVYYRNDGTVARTLRGPYSLTCFNFDEESGVLAFGSAVTGGDGLYLVDLKDPAWERRYKNLQPVGRLVEIEENLRILDEQIAAFERPAYQARPRATTLITKNLTETFTGDGQQVLEEAFLRDYDYETLAIGAYYTRSENFDRSGLKGKWVDSVDRRRRYNFSAGEIIAFAREREAKGEPFGLWAGHGHDPFFIQLSTLEQVLEAAPTMLKALVFAELEHLDEDLEYAFREHLLPLAELCRRQGTTRIVLRNKNVFWNASIYTGFWRELFEYEEYRDVFVPSMEETNCRTQALSLSGRVGLWMSGAFGSLSSRAVTDNSNFTRFINWDALQFQTHHVRKLAYQASLGADLFLVNIYQGDPRDVAPAYRMIDKGIIAIPEPDELLSVSDFCLGMDKPTESFLFHGRNGHGATAYRPGEEERLFSRLDAFWAGAVLPDYDFSNYGLGVRRRELNFLPSTPYGLVAMVPARTPVGGDSHWQEKVITDGTSVFFEPGEATTPTAAREKMLEMLEASAARLPVRVTGEVAWSVVRLGPHHVRVCLFDSGYLSPAARPARIRLQHLEGRQATDILAQQSLDIKDGQIELVVPAASLRVIDIHHR